MQWFYSLKYPAIPISMRKAFKSLEDMQLI